jgi:cytochrome c-type biogenesis protein CcmH/NrfG
LTRPAVRRKLDEHIQADVRTTSTRRRTVHAETTSAGPLPAVLRGIFALVAVLVLAAIGYAGWIVVRYWDQVGV